MSAFNKNEIVWAKVKGHPWWPALILRAQSFHGKNSKKEYLVNFIGDNSHATVKEEKLADFTEKFKQFSNVKNKKLQDGIKAAQRIYNGESTYEEEIKNLDKRKRKASQSVDKEEKGIEIEEKLPCSPKKTRTRRQNSSAKKQKEPKEIEEKSHIPFESLLDFIPNRVTRAQCKDQHIEVLTEPLLYLSKKTANLITFSGKKEHHSENNDKTDCEYQYQSRKSSIELCFNEQPVEKIVDKENINSQNLLNNSSPSHTFNTAASEESVSDLTKITIERRKATASRVNKRKKIIISQTIEQISSNSDKEEVRPLISPAYRSKNATSSPNFAQTIPMVHAFEIKETNSNHEHEEIKPKINNKPMGIKEFEIEFEYLLKLFTKRFKNGELLKENDLNTQKLRFLIDEFQKLVVPGSELIDSSVGKIFKTIEYVFIKNKQLLNKKGQIIIKDISLIINGLKDKILRYCLDNTGYMELLHFSPENKESNPHNHINNYNNTNTSKSNSRMEIEVNEINHKSTQADTKTPKYDNKKLVLEETSPVTTKIEDSTPRSFNNQMSPQFHPIITNLKELQNFSLDSASKASVRKDSNDSFISKSGNSSHPAEILLLRKKVCHRIIKLLQESFKMDKDKAQELTLRVEGKINEFYSHFVEDYKQAIQNLYRLIKIHYLNLNDVYGIKDMTITKFNEMLQQKLQQALENGAGGDQANFCYHSMSSDVLESPSLKGFRFDLMAKFDHFPTEKINENHNLKPGYFSLPSRQTSTPKGNETGIMSS